MKKVALLLYDQFCNFEISVALEMLAMAGTPIAIFAKDLKAVKSEEGFTPEDLSQMIGWDDNIASPIKQGYLKTGNVITSISYNFIQWSMAVGRELGIEVYPKSFGLD